MKKLLILAIVAAAAWYGWKNYPSLFERRPSHEAVIENQTGTTITKVRLSVDGQTLVKEEIADGAKAVIPFRVSKDASFTLIWEWSDRPGENTWAGGLVPQGPMVQRHIMLIDNDAGVLYRAENK